MSESKASERVAKSVRFVLKHVQDAYLDNMNQIEQEAFSHAIEIGITQTVSALYDADVKDEEIIHALNKYWRIESGDAEQRLMYEKQQAPIRELSTYLRRQGYSDADIRSFMISTGAGVKISHDRELWKLRRHPAKLMEQIQSSTSARKTDR